MLIQPVSTMIFTGAKKYPDIFDWGCRSGNNFVQSNKSRGLLFTAGSYIR